MDNLNLSSLTDIGPQKFHCSNSVRNLTRVQFGEELKQIECLESLESQKVAFWGKIQFGYDCNRMRLVQKLLKRLMKCRGRTQSMMTKLNETE